MVTVTVIGPNLIDQRRGQFEVHAVGCGARFRNTRETTDSIFEVDDLEELVGDLYYHQIEESHGDVVDYLDEFHVHDCARRAGLRRAVQR